MPGQVLVSVHLLLAIRDAIIAGDEHEAYHQLRIACDPECANAIHHGNHWHPWEEIAKAVPQKTA